MKKFYLIIICLFTLISPVNALEKYKVSLNKCVDGDTAWFNLNGKIIKTRFLAIDTPESTKKIEPFGKKASDYTCGKLKNASNIYIEYDPNSNKLDKYNRHLVWIFVDNTLLQKELVENGLAKVKYIYADYLYLDELKESEKKAIDKRINIWEYNNTFDNLFYNILFFVLIVGIIIIFKPNKKTIKKIIREYKKRMK